jgi:hypothetical protein
MQIEWKSTGDDCLDSLATQGDSLEREICCDCWPLFLAIQPYSRIWKNHILPRRVGDGAFLTDDWQEFGGRHYTALIRLHHAYCAKEEIVQLCNEAGDYSKLLRVHSACTAFWNNIGASIDNFMNARSAAKKLMERVSEKRNLQNKCEACGGVIKDLKFEGKTVPALDYPHLDYAFQRRNQFIHSIVVPHDIVGDKIVFGLEHFDDEVTKWSSMAFSKQELGSKIEADWNDVLKQIGNAWESLYSYLQEHDKVRPIEKHSTESTCGDGSVDYKYRRSEKKPMSSSGSMETAPVSGVMR